MIEDKLLIWRFKCGSRDALCKIYEKYKNDLLKLASAILNERNSAEDVVHDVFVSFAQSSERLKLSGSLKYYLATCVMNRVRNLKRTMQLSEAMGLNEDDPIVSKSERPEQWIMCREESNQLNNAIVQLPDEQRQVIAMHLYGGMKFRAIAKSQNVSVNTFK
jgi:RNA polymerase sigma-70 factor (ECF subfamily)